MQRMDLVEEIGSGLARINQLMEEYLLPHPKVEVDDLQFRIIFARPDLQKMSVEQRMEKHRQGWTSEDQSESARKSVEKTTQKTTQKILGLIRENPHISRSVIAQELGDITEDGVKYNLAKLRKEKKIKRIGPDKGGIWEVVDNK